MPDPKNPSPTAPAEASPKKGFVPDTGTGGFPIGNNEYVYDIGVVAADGSKGKWSKGNIDTYAEPQDISQGTKKTLASYMSDLTKAKLDVPHAPKIKNAYSVDGEISEYSLTTPLGYPSAPLATGNGEKFVDTNGNNYIVAGREIPRRPETLSSVSNTYIKTFGVDAPKFVKGKNALKGEGVVDGHSLLAQGPELAVSTAMKDYSSAILINRFSVDNPYAGVTESNQFTRDDTSPQFDKSYRMGVSPSPITPDDFRLSHGQLAHVGTLLTLRAGQELGSSDAGAKGGDLEEESLLPGWNQLGTERIERFRLEARDVLETLTNDPIDTEKELFDPTGLSWGSLNNTHDRFAGVSNFGMQLLSIALLLAIGIVFGAFSALIPFSPPPLGVTETGLNAGMLPLGSYGNRGRDIDFSLGGIIKAIGSGTVNWLSLLGLQTTFFSYFSCLFVGGLAFFGIPFDAETKGAGASALEFGKAVGDAAIAGSQNPGFNVTVARLVNRSFLRIIDAFSDFSKVGNPVSGIKQIFEIISAIRESKFIKSINIFSQLGNQILLSRKVDDVTHDNDYGKRISSIDANDKINGPGRSAFEKQRLGTKGKSRALAWSSYRAIDRIIVPSSLLKSVVVGQKLGTPSFFASESEHLRTAGGQSITPHIAVDGGRIPTEEREKWENYLDAEYVPFYFHDVRTNEIVSFHAFLASLTDDYSASYDSAEAFGRVEPIKIYKNTSRKISFSFVVAALSEKDFDSMWIKINKLTTLVYPQFTKGKIVNSQDGKYSITAPFSQMISASPMTRIRIGDLIRSNYSKFNLARLFGYGNPDSIFNEKKGDSFSKRDDALSNKIQEEMTKAKSANSKYSWTASVNLPKAEPNSSLTGESTDPEINAPLPKGCILKIKEVKTDGDGKDATKIATCEVELIANPEAEPSLGVTAADITAAKNLYDNKDLLPTKIVGRQFKIDASSLVMTPDSYLKLLKDVGAPGDQADYQTAIEDFMNDEATDKGNVVVKSFRSVGGKGLAGFIESMSFDWMDRVTWETKASEGYRAPKLCKVTVSFSPIHDITPGLDWQGANRAPIYPVGPMSPRPIPRAPSK